MTGDAARQFLGTFRCTINIGGDGMVQVQFMTNGHPDNVWQVLETFHYDRALDLAMPAFSPVATAKDQQAELTAEAIHFLSALFKQYATVSASSHICTPLPLDQRDAAVMGCRIGCIIHSSAVAEVPCVDVRI